MPVSCVGAGVVGAAVGVGVGATVTVERCVVLPPVGKDDQVVAGGGIDLAGHFQHLAAVVAVHRVLELPDRAARGRAVNAVVRTGGQMAEG